MLFDRWPVYQRVLVNLDDGTALDGVLVARRGSLLVLADTTLLSDQHDPTQLDGDVYIERARVRFLQARGQPSLFP